MSKKRKFRDFDNDDCLNQNQNHNHHSTLQEVKDCEYDELNDNAYRYESSYDANHLIDAVKDAFLSHHTFIQHHMASYEKFVDQTIDEMVHEYPLRVWYTENANMMHVLEFSTIRIEKPIVRERDGHVHDLYPYEAIQKSLNYNLNIYLTIIYKCYALDPFVDEEIDKLTLDQIKNLLHGTKMQSSASSHHSLNENNYFWERNTGASSNRQITDWLHWHLIHYELFETVILELPCMVRSKYCHLYKLPFYCNECPMNAGGYFIAKGNTNAIENRIEIRHNYPFVIRDEKKNAVLKCDYRPEKNGLFGIALHVYLYANEKPMLTAQLHDFIEKYDLQDTDWITSDTSTSPSTVEHLSHTHGKNTLLLPNWMFEENNHIEYQGHTSTTNDLSFSQSHRNIETRVIRQDDHLTPDVDSLKRVQLQLYQSFLAKQPHVPELLVEITNIKHTSPTIVSLLFLFGINTRKDMYALLCKGIQDTRVKFWLARIVEQPLMPVDTHPHSNPLVLNQFAPQMNKKWKMRHADYHPIQEKWVHHALNCIYTIYCKLATHADFDKDLKTMYGHVDASTIHNWFEQYKINKNLYQKIDLSHISLNSSLSYHELLQMYVELIMCLISHPYVKNYMQHVTCVDHGKRQINLFDLSYSGSYPWMLQYDDPDTARLCTLDGWTRDQVIFHFLKNTIYPVKFDASTLYTWHGFWNAKIDDTRENATKMKPQPLDVDLADFTSAESLEKLFNILTSEIFVNLGTNRDAKTLSAKSEQLAKIVRKMLLVYLGITPEDDKDHLNCKSIVTTGNLLAQLVKQSFRNNVKLIMGNIMDSFGAHAESIRRTSQNTTYNLKKIRTLISHIRNTPIKATQHVSKKKNDQHSNSLRVSSKSKQENTMFPSSSDYDDHLSKKHAKSTALDSGGNQDDDMSSPRSQEDCSNNLEQSNHTHRRDFIESLKNTEMLIFGDRHAGASTWIKKKWTDDVESSVASQMHQWTQQRFESAHLLSNTNDTTHALSTYMCHLFLKNCLSTTQIIDCLSNDAHLHIIYKACISNDTLHNDHYRSLVKNMSFESFKRVIQKHLLLSDLICFARAEWEFTVAHDIESWNVIAIVRVNFTKNGLQYAINTGTWTTSSPGTTDNVAVGVCRRYAPYNILHGFSILNRIGKQINSQNRSDKPRQLESSYFGRICPVYTSDGARCGLVVQKTIGSILRTGYTIQTLLYTVLRPETCVFPYHYKFESKNLTSESVPVHINGIQIGYTIYPYHTMAMLKHYRRQGNLPYDVGITWIGSPLVRGGPLQNPNCHYININALEGGLVRMLFVAKNLYKLAQLVDTHGYDTDVLWHTLLHENVVEMMDIEEESNAHVADDLLSLAKDTCRRYYHVDFKNRTPTRLSSPTSTSSRHDGTIFSSSFIESNHLNDSHVNRDNHQRNYPMFLSSSASASFESHIYDHSFQDYFWSSEIPCYKKSRMMDWLDLQFNPYLYKCESRRVLDQTYDDKCKQIQHEYDAFLNNFTTHLFKKIQDSKSCNDDMITEHERHVSHSDTMDGSFLHDAKPNTQSEFNYDNMNSSTDYESEDYYMHLMNFYQIPWSTKHYVRLTDHLTMYESIFDAHSIQQSNIFKITQLHNDSPHLNRTVHDILDRMDFIRYEWRSAYSHCNVHPNLNYGVNASVAIDLGKTHAARNLYGGNMRNQSSGNGFLNLKYMTNKYHMQLEPNDALVKTHLDDNYAMFGLARGSMPMMVGFLSMPGNAEDANVVSKSYDQYGSKRTIMSHFIKSSNREGKELLRYTKPNPYTCLSIKSFNYDHLNENGYPKIGDYIDTQDIILGRVFKTKIPISSFARQKMIEKLEITYMSNLMTQPDIPPPKTLIDLKNSDTLLYYDQDKSIRYPCRHSGYIQSILSLDEGSYLKIKTISQHIPGIGDKFTTQHGQKGVIGDIKSCANMPYTVDYKTGRVIYLDRLMNPHCIPSRMTLGQNYELMAGTINMLGYKSHDIDGTSMDTKLLPELKRLLKKINHSCANDTRVVYNGETGAAYQNPISMGPLAILCLKQIAIMKLKSRSRGVNNILTHQPVEMGEHGGCRFGEMERDNAAAHGAMHFLQQCLSTASDYSIFLICKCGNFAEPKINLTEHQSFDTKNMKHLGYCRVCDSYDHVRLVSMTYAFMLLILECMSQGINWKLIVEDNQLVDVDHDTH